MKLVIVAIYSSFVTEVVKGEWGEMEPDMRRADEYISGPVGGEVRAEI